MCVCVCVCVCVCIYIYIYIYILLTIRNINGSKPYNITHASFTIPEISIKSYR